MLELNGIINSTIVHLNGHTLALHDKTTERFIFFLSKEWPTIFYNDVFNDKRFNKFEEQEVIMY